MKRILITGANSYVGTSFEKWMLQWPEQYFIDTLDMKDGTWREKDFSGYDVVYHVAGIAHVDVGKVDEETKKLYYDVNTELTKETASKAKSQGVKQFIFMSSSIIYGDSAPIGRKKVITKDIEPRPSNFYGNSKLQADKWLQSIRDDVFKVVILRAPMIYGENSKGNYAVLSKLAKKIPIFPDIESQRSMIYIENLCEFVKLMIDNEEQGIFWPQNEEYVRTSEMVKRISDVHNKKVLLTPIFKLPVYFASKLPGKIGRNINKAFGNLTYDYRLSSYVKDYNKYNFLESIALTEGKKLKEKKHILIISQYFYPEQFRINDICTELSKRNYKITVLTGIPNYPKGKFYEGYGWNKKREEYYNGIHIIRIPIISRGNGTIRLILNYISFVVSGLLWIMRTKVKVDKVFIYEVSPMTQALVGVWYAKKNKIPCYLYVTDLWPENVEIITGITNPIVINPIEKMVKYIYKECTRIFTSSNTFIEEIMKRNISKEKLEFWPQYAEDFYKQVENIEPVKELKNEERFNIVFAGNIGMAQGLEVLPKAAILLKNENINVCFTIIGDGRYKEQLIKDINNYDLSEMFYIFETQPAHLIPNFMANCNAALICLGKSKVFSMTIPAKTQSCMACGMPIIVCADGEVQDIIKEAQCGIGCNAGDYVELAKSIKEMVSLPKTMIDQMSRNSISYANLHFNKDKLISQLEKYL